MKVSENGRKGEVVFMRAEGRSGVEREKMRGLALGY